MKTGKLEFENNMGLFKCISIPFSGEAISQSGVSLDPRKGQALTEMLPPKCKKELHSFLDILNYLHKVSPVIAEICKPLQLRTSVKADWT